MKNTNSKKISRRDAIKSTIATGVGTSLFLGSDALAQAHLWSDGTESPYAKSFEKVLKGRRSRRFARGIKTKTGILAYESQKEVRPLSEKETAFLAFCGAGITGFALGDLVYDPKNDGQMMAGFVGRTAPSADAGNSASLIVVSDDGTYLIQNPNLMSVSDIKEVISLVKANQYVEAYRTVRVKISDKKLVPPLAPPFNYPVNQWDLYQPGTTYFFPVFDPTFININGGFSFLGENFGGYIVDERRGFRSAGLEAFTKENGGHLDPNPLSGKTSTVQAVDSFLQAWGGVETGAMAQNILLGAESMGLGAFPNYAAHPAWFAALGFEMETMPSAQYLGREEKMDNDIDVPYPVALKVGDRKVLKPYCVPNYGSMKEAVEAVYEFKYGKSGVYGDRLELSAFKDKKRFRELSNKLRPSEAAVEACAAFFQYVYDTYGRVPCHQNALSCPNVGVQVSHVDTDFYKKHYAGY